MKLYSRISDHETILELWASSTKHPDSVFYFSDFEIPKGFEGDLSDPIFIYQWLIECASKLTWWFHTRELVDFANESFDEFDENFRKMKKRGLDNK